MQALRTFDDAARLQAALSPGARLSVVGGGLIGLEVASSARRAGVEVTVIEAAPGLLPRLGPAVGARLAALHRADGVVLHARRAALPLRVAERRALKSSYSPTGRASRPIM